MSKSPYAKAIKEFTRLVEKHGLDRDKLNYVCRMVKEGMPENEARKVSTLPKVMTESQLQTFFEAVTRAEHPQDEFMFKLMLSTGLRVSELTGIRISDIDRTLKHIKVMGKGSKERMVPYPESLADIMWYHMSINRDNVFLFERRSGGKLSTRYVQRIVKGYVEASGLPAWITPHTFRHQCITRLSASGMSSSQIKVITGHSTNKALEIYQHVSLAGVEDEYQRIMGGE